MLENVTYGVALALPYGGRASGLRMERSGTVPLPAEHQLYRTLDLGEVIKHHLGRWCTMASTEQVWIERGCSRSEEREPAAASVAYRSGLKRASVDVVDISRTGARICALDPLQAGSSFWIKLPNLEPLEMQIIWSKGFEAGCRFLKPLHPAIFRVVAQAVR